MNTPRILFCSPVIPEYDRESGSRRLYDLVRILRKANWHVTFFTRQTADERYLKNLQRYGVLTYSGNDASLEQLVKHSSFDMALLAFWSEAEEHLPLIRKESPNTRIVIDSIDLHFMRNARRAFLSGDSAVANSLDDAFADEMRREINVYAAADAVLTVSQKEADLINDMVGAGRAWAVPDGEALEASAAPLEQRKGILFLGNFRHAPNVNAVEFLCKEIAPHLDPGLLKDHPLYVVGNDMSDKIAELGNGIPNIRMVGWVPSVVPYLQQARLTVVPLLYGAGTKRKLVQALMVGTPTVSTTVGVEGLNLRDGEHILIADDPRQFADCIHRLLVDRNLWEKIAQSGRALITASHGRDRAENSLLAVMNNVLASKVRPMNQNRFRSELNCASDYHDRIVPRIHEIVRTALPEKCRILVVSKGDEAIVEFTGRKGEHFPQVGRGIYAGNYPQNCEAAIAHLDSVRTNADYLLFPCTAFWWFEHYAEFFQHLRDQYAVVVDDETCRIFALTKAKIEPAPNGRHTMMHENGKSNGSHKQFAAASMAPPRAPAAGISHPHLALSKANRKKILVLGVYLANQANLAHEIVPELAKSNRFTVTQRWLALGGPPPTTEVAAVTVRTVTQKIPKFQLMNDLLEQETLQDYEYVLLADDDITLPTDFIDQYFTLQGDLDFRIAQPARTSRSYIDHPIVEQQHGVIARQTLFVEIGPVVSFHRSIFPIVFPFDLTSSMGWGYENVWSYILAQRNLKMGIIDVLPVDHSMRKPVANYRWEDADRERSAYLAKYPHFPIGHCFRVVDVINHEEVAS